MAASKLQQQVTQTLAEAYNLVSQAEFPGLKGNQVRTVAKTLESFQAVVQSLAEEKLIIEEASNPLPADFANRVVPQGIDNEAV